MKFVCLTTTLERDDKPRKGLRQTLQLKNYEKKNHRLVCPTECLGVLVFFRIGETKAGKYTNLYFMGQSNGNKLNHQRINLCILSKVELKKATNH